MDNVRKFSAGDIAYFEGKPAAIILRIIDVKTAAGNIAHCYIYQHICYDREERVWPDDGFVGGAVISADQIGIYDHLHQTVAEVVEAEVNHD